MLTFTESTTITGQLSAIWNAVSDVAAWATWDPHVEKVRFEGPFAPGTKGWTKPRGAPAGEFRLTAVEPQRSYATASPMPGGTMSIFNTYEPVGPNRVIVARRVELDGWFTPIFKLFWAKGMRSDIHHMFAALEQEAQRRAAQTA